MRLKGSGSRQVLAGVIGNALEWYDFAVYGFFAPIIGRVFFPSDDPTASLLAAYGVLAAGFFSRPIGSMVFGHIADRIGRKPSLMLSIAIMGLATLGIALLPGHAELGATAAVLLVVLRTVQGLAVAGEFGASAVLLVEQAPANRRGWVGSWVMTGSNIGFLLGSGVGALISALLAPDQLDDWGWRIAFLIGALIALLALFARRTLAETLTAEARAASRPPLVEALRHWRAIAQMVFLLLPTAVTFYIAFVYATSYLTDSMHFSTAEALDVSTLALFVLTAVGPLAGLWTDRVGRRPLLLAVALAGLLLTWPLWYALHQGTLAWILVAQLSFAAINGVGWALSVPLMVELLPPGVRCTASGIAYNLCMALFGGAAPWIATYLVERTGDDFAPAWFIMAAALVSCLAALKLRETAFRPLPTEVPAT